MDIGYGSHTWQCCVSRYRQHACIDSVHTWASVFLRHLASTSFMVPFWPYTISSSVPIPESTQLEATLVRRMLFIVLMTAAHISPKVFSLRVASHQCTANILLWYTAMHTFILYITFIRTFTSSYFTPHSYVHSYLHSFISSALHGRLAALDSLYSINCYSEWFDSKIFVVHNEIFEIHTF
jgi:hypothetical protein